MGAGNQPGEQSVKPEPKSKRNGPKWTQNEKAHMSGKEGCSFALGAVGLGVNGKHRLWKDSQHDKAHSLKLEGALLPTCFGSSHEIWNWASPAYYSAALSNVKGFFIWNTPQELSSQRRLHYCFSFLPTFTKSFFTCTGDLCLSKSPCALEHVWRSAWYSTKQLD